MIARRLRLRRSRDFERVRRRGRTVADRLLVLSVAPNGLEHNRYGFAVGKRVGKAVRRNKVKRWLREAVRRFHPELEQGYDIVFVARGALAEPSVTYHEVAAQVESLLRRVGLWRATEERSAGAGEQSE
ncbi:ribonuclease P protein component [Thermomicrobium sp. 4228-Ro]|uniref:ribonuclease P protein component n=1 Tax=Thermomicrobium sp. 4228-Ro TaxID=2993937 RepID=UPI002248790D|nr:ribonuclease P protein component [Thermomicrobium sp. 4228-Ro]MCX2727639.1 ribonuclease P protein component [Thermomicrobium sp. 4228-Ro]